MFYICIMWLCVSRLLLCGYVVSSMCVLFLYCCLNVYCFCLFSYCCNWLRVFFSFCMLLLSNLLNVYIVVYIVFSICIMCVYGLFNFVKLCYTKFLILLKKNVCYVVVFVYIFLKMFFKMCKLCFNVRSQSFKSLNFKNAVFCV